MRDFIIANILIFIKVANCNLLEPRASQNCIHKVSLYYISKPCGELVGQQHVHALPLLRQRLRSGHDWPHRKTTSIQRSIPFIDKVRIGWLAAPIVTWDVDFDGGKLDFAPRDLL